jgi:hypothetical protein
LPLDAPIPCPLLPTLMPVYPPPPHAPHPVLLFTPRDAPRISHPHPPPHTHTPTHATTTLPLVSQVLETIIKLHGAYRLRCPEWEGAGVVPLAAVGPQLLAGHALSSDALLHCVAVHEVTKAEVEALQGLGGVTGAFSLGLIAHHLATPLSRPDLQSAVTQFQGNFRFRGKGVARRVGVAMDVGGVDPPLASPPSVGWLEFPVRRLGHLAMIQPQGGGTDTPSYSELVALCAACARGLGWGPRGEGHGGVCQRW